jgi:hypothetical protein
MDWRYFDPERDLAAATRVWHEIGWLNRHDPSARRGFEAYTLASRGYVALVYARPECFVFRTAGTLRYLQKDLPVAAITGVATGRNARKQGLALGLTAKAVVEAAADGAAVAGLSTFEPGFYDRIGFGNSAYDHIWRIDPARLTVDDRVRAPHHLDEEHIACMHDARLSRHRAHGSVSLASCGMTQSIVLRSPNGFGLGYFDDGVETPSHCLWCSTTQTARGPYTIEFMAWRTPAQFRELLGLIKQWGDQVRLVILAEPPGIPLQDFLDRTNQHYVGTEGGILAGGNRAAVQFQYRILDLEACIRATEVSGPPVAFSLRLQDPIASIAVDGVGSLNLTGNYRVELGSESRVARGDGGDLPVLTASVGAFTRLWLGACTATGLTMSGAIEAPPALVEALDTALRLPAPVTDWQY